jgi:MFS family permease
MFEPLEGKRMNIYIITFVVIFGVLIVLKFVEGSPVRSWTAVFLIGIPLGLLGGYWFNHALPEKPAPLPQSVKASAYRQELERTVRRIAGVDSASIEGTTIRMNFAQEKPMTELRSIAMQVGGTASYFLRTNDKNAQVTVHMTVQGRDRYEVDFGDKGGLSNEQTF